MPLRDHFHPPLLDDPPWPSLATMWAGSLTAALNAALRADGYTAYANVKSALKTEGEFAARRRDLAALGPPARVAFVVPNYCEVWVGDGRHELNLAGVVLFVDPEDQTTAVTRAAVVGRCTGYLARGVGVVTVDVVTTGSPQVTTWVPTHHPDGTTADIWTFPAAVGAPLPAAPLALRGGPVVTVELEATYTAALRGLNAA